MSHSPTPDEASAVPNSSGKTALVTGGTDGVGLCIATRLAAQGAAVVVNGRDPDKGERAVAHLRALGSDAAFVQADLRNYDQVRRAIEHTVELRGRLDILVSAGAPSVGTPKPFAEMTADELEAVVSSRFFPRIFPLHAAIGALQESQGCAVLLTTDAARHPTPGEGVIGAVGAGIILLTKAVAKELSRQGVRVNTVAMTLTSGTPGWDRIFAQEGFQNELFTKALSRFPSGRAPRAAEVAAVVAFLASDDAAQVTGQTVSVNGGLSFGGW